MAVLALDAVTLASITDVSYMRRYYLMQASTLAAPVVPTTNPPLGAWSTTEPSYTEGSTNSLYVTDLVVFSDGTFDYLPVQKSSSYEAAKVAYNAAVAARDAANAANNNAISRGTDLVTNGTGLLGNNTNFTTFSFVSNDAPTGAAGSFLTAGTGSRTIQSDEYIPVDPSKKYVLAASVRETVSAGASKFYAGFAAYDAFNQVISPFFYYIPRVSTTRTTLAADLKNGDTTATLTNGTGWTASNGYLLTWNYVDAAGKAWPVGTYSRNVKQVTAVNGNVVTLASAWNLGTVPAGTVVDNSASSGAYSYAIAALKDATSSWVRWTSPVVTGVTDGTRGAYSLDFPPGCAKIRLLVLAQYAGSAADARQAFANFSMSDATAAQATADAAQLTASGKNQITWSLNDAPVSAAGTRAGDVWNKYVLVSNKLTIVATWTSDAATWKPSVISETYLPQVNIGTGTYGELDGIRLKAKTVQANTVLVDGSVGRVLIENGAVNADKVEAQSVAGAVGAFLQLDAGQLTVTGNTTLNSAVIQTLFTQTFATNKITANEVNAASIGAAVGQFVSIEAQQISGGSITAEISMWAGGRIIAGQWTGACAVMSAMNGFETKQVDANDVQFTATSMGNPNGQNQLAIFNAPNAPAVFSVSEEGVISGKDLVLEEDPVFAGRPLLGKLFDPASDDGWLDDAPRGMVGYGNIQSGWSTEPTLAGGAGTYLPLAVVGFQMTKGRVYRVTMPYRFTMSAYSSGARAGVATFYEWLTGEPAEPKFPAGAEPGSTRTGDMVQPFSSQVASSGGVLTFMWQSPFAGPVNIKLLVCAWAQNCTVGLSKYNPFDWQVTVEDVGPIIESTSRILDTSGATTPPPAKRTYTSTWKASSSRAYLGNGTPSNLSIDTTKKVLRHGYYDALGGDSRSVFVCSGTAYTGETGKTVAQALSGATLTKAEIFIQSLHWYASTGGRAILRPLGSSTLPATLTNAQASSTAMDKVFTSRVQGFWVQVPTSWFSGSATGVVLGPTANTSRAQYGYFAAHDHPTDSYRPRIRLTYTR